MITAEMPGVLAPTYLDYNATAPVRPEARDAALEAISVPGNPSSVHSSGRHARMILERARSEVASLFMAPPSAIIFSSGGTEANCTAVHSAIAAGSRRLVISAIEHDSVRETALASGLPCEEWPVGAEGVVEPDWLAARLGHWRRDDGPPFVALMASNNETGVIQPVAEAAALVHAAGGWFHVDAVQAAGKIRLDQPGMKIDTLSCSAHKLGGFSGVGALAVATERTIVPLITGGGQERNRRSGTENLAGIAAFGAAARLALRELDGWDALARWRDRCAAQLRAAAPVVLLGWNSARVPGTLNFATPGFPSLDQVMAMDFRGIMVSAGSACSAGKLRESRIAVAMGHGAIADTVLRVSGGWNSSIQDWEKFADAWIEAHEAHVRAAVL